jgi:hypothetical protein
MIGVPAVFFLPHREGHFAYGSPFEKNKKENFLKKYIKNFLRAICWFANKASKTGPLSPRFNGSLFDGT